MQTSDLKHLNNPENVLSIAPSPSRPRRSSWRRFWRHSFLGRVFLFALSSGVGGAFVGALIGLANWLSSGPFHPWWYWVGFTAPVNGVWMMIVGFVVGLVVFSGSGLAGSRWSASRKRRFARRMKTRLFVPIVASLVVTSLVAVPLWIIRHPSDAPTADLGNVLGDTELVTLPFAACLFMLLLVRSSKTKPSRRQMPIPTERLLPLD